jgi:hypothetical protein
MDTEMAADSSAMAAPLNEPEFANGAPVGHPFAPDA